MNLTELTDEEFDAFYPLKIQKLSSRHWTPITVTKKAIRFLSEGPTTKILDIGSGAGKFCLLAAAFSQSPLTGVEQRDSLVRLSRKLAGKFNLSNVNFIHENIRNIDFGTFDAFYFFNAFEENRDPTDQIDKESFIDPCLYEEYCLFLRQQFDLLPVGTKIVTYCSECKEIPESYVLVQSGIKGKLRFWIKRYG